MTRTLEQTRRWTEEGTALLGRAVARAGDDALLGSTLLPGWTGRHLVAHLALNAEALGNLVHWARTGEETPMYSSTAQRDADIAAGSTRPVGELRDWSAAAAQHLQDGLDTLTDEQWQRPVRTAQGREVPSAEIPWLRAREVMVHAVDLDSGTTFADLPEDFLRALLDDIVAKRAATPDHPALVLTDERTDHRWAVAPRPDAPVVTGTVAELVAYLTGRADGSDLTTSSLTTRAGSPVPALPRWL